MIAVSTVAVMASPSWQPTLATSALMPIVLVPSRLLGRANHRARRRVQEKPSQVSTSVQEVLGILGILLLKAFGRDHRGAALRPAEPGPRGLKIRQRTVERWFGMLSSALQALGPVPLLLLGGHLVLTGRTTVGTVVDVVTAGRTARRLRRDAGRSPRST